MRSLFFAALPLLLASDPAAAVDYDKIERKLTKEPKYQTQKPAYGLLLFGKQAQVRVWLVLDGDTLYLDRNADGDLTGENEKFASLKDCKNFVLPDPDRKTRYLIAQVKSYDKYYSDKELRQRKDRGIHGHLAIDAHIQGPTPYLQRSELEEMWDTPAKAHLSHFHGPLTIETLKYNYAIPPGLKLNAEDGKAEVVAFVGTMSKKHGCWVVLGSSIDVNRRPVPKGVHPVVEIEYPPKDPGGKPIRVRSELQEFC